MKQTIFSIIISLGVGASVAMSMVNFFENRDIASAVLQDKQNIAQIVDFLNKATGQTATVPPVKTK